MIRLFQRPRVVVGGLRLRVPFSVAWLVAPETDKGGHEYEKDIHLKALSAYIQF